MRLAFPRVRFAVALVLLLAPAAVSADTGTTGFAFLKLGVGARAMGLGSAYVALADDPTAIYWNAAGLASLTGTQVTAMHNEWIQDSFDLGGRIPFTNTMRMRVHTCDQGGGSLLEAAFDDVLLSTRTFSLVAVNPPPTSTHQLALENAYPMPSAGPTTVFFTLPGTDGATVRASLRLYDARGRLVRTLRDGELPAGRTSAVWDGADESGRHVGAGTYLLRLEAGRRWASEKVVLTR